MTGRSDGDGVGHDDASRQPVNFADRGIQLTRSARALKVWLSLQVLGVDAFRAAIDRCLDLATYAEERIRVAPGFELLSPANLGVVCFRASAGSSEESIERLNERLVRELAESGVGLISSTRLHGRYALRLCILNHRTTRDDVDRVLGWLQGSLADLVDHAGETSR